MPLTTCQDCGAKISTEAHACPSCGRPNPKSQNSHRRVRSRPRFGWWALVIAISVLVLVIYKGFPSPTKQHRESLTPQQESQFLNIVVAAQDQANQTSNGVRLDEIRARRRHAVCAILKVPEVAGWVGRVKNIDSTMSGDGIVSISLAPDVDVATWNNVLSDAEDQTIISKKSKLFAILGKLSNGEKVLFSGAFVLSSGCPKETSLTTDGSLSAPSYLFRFSSIKPLHGS